MKILIAYDEAFNFVYRANIDVLRRHGEAGFFSPMHDEIKLDCDMLYLPGGYPELFLKEISENRFMMNAIKTYAENGGMVYAECGGFMYLCNEIDGTPMCGVLPFKATMESARLHLGYRKAMLPDGVLIRGHEFHYSDVIDSYSPDVKRICLQTSAKGAKTATPIYRYKNVIAGYTHWYWAEQGFSFFNSINKI